MTHRNRAAVDVERIRRNAQRVAAIQHLHRKGFVEFPQVNIADLQAQARQHFRHRDHRANAHLIGLTARHRKAQKTPQRLQPALLHQPLVHYHHRTRAVGELAGVSGGHQAAGNGRAQAVYALKSGASAYAFVVAHGHFAGDHAGLFVDHTHGHGDRCNLVSEAPGLQRGAGFLLAARAVDVHGFAADLVALGDLFSGLQHVPVHLRLVLHQPGVGGHVLVSLVLHARDRLHAPGHIHIALVGHHPLRGQRNGLQARRTKPVHGQT